MKKEILQTVKTHDLFREHTHIVLGLSGGPDSMCLFDVLCRLAGEMDLSIHPVHVNHQLRPGAADEDQSYVEDCCAARGFPCRSFRYDCGKIAKEKGMTSEEAGREARYEAFSIAAEEIRAAGVPREQIVIAVAQNADDQCETILFRFLRGTGVDGLSGIAYKRYDEKGNKIVRPLLDITRRQIEAYCRERNLAPRRDHTNEEPVYSRNKIRLQLIPYLKEDFNPNLEETVIRLGESAAMDRDYLWVQASSAFQKAVTEIEENEENGEKTVSLSIKLLREFHPAIRRRVYHKALETAGMTGDISAAHLLAADRLLESANPSAELCLPDGYRIFKVYDRLRMGKYKEKQENGAGRFRVFFADGKRRMQKPFSQEAALAFFSYQKLEQRYGKDVSEKICLRSRQQGDFIAVFTGGAVHRKKLQDLFVDEKIPKGKREQILLAAVGSEILWILPEKAGEKGRFSADYKVSSEGEERIITLEYLFHM